MPNAHKKNYYGNNNITQINLHYYYQDDADKTDESR